jgi:Domain of unknown function (DUF4350)
MTATDVLGSSRPRSTAELSAGAPRSRNRWRSPLVIAAIVVLGGIAVALLAPRPAAPSGYLDPDSTQPTGTRALNDLLAGRGTQVVRVASAQAAAAAVQQGASAIVVTSPALLSSQQLRTIASARAAVLLVEPTSSALTVLAPAIALAGYAAVRPAEPECGLPAAMLAGNADLGGPGLRLEAGSPGITCYPGAGGEFLAQYGRGTGQVTVLSSGAPLQNQHLAALGNAALALNLLGGRGRVAWLVPSALEGLGTPAGEPASLWSLVPLGAYLVAAELGVALLMAAAWRARRLGPLVAEQLPVVVRAAETTEGHARLYQAVRAREQAAQSLRRAVIGRLMPALGLAPETGADAVASEIASRTRLTPDQVQRLLFGPAPVSDAQLVSLADDLDAMEREVRAQ